MDTTQNPVPAPAVVPVHPAPEVASEAQSMAATTPPAAPPITPAPMPTTPVPPETPKKKSGALKWIIILLVALLVLCCIIPSVLYALLGEKFLKTDFYINGVTPTPTATVEITTTPTGTPTPEGSIPTGYEWKYCTNMNAWFIKPASWDTMETSINNIPLCALTEGRASDVKTSSVSFGALYYDDVSTTYSVTASQYAKQLVETTIKSHENSGLKTTTTNNKYPTYSSVFEYTDSESGLSITQQIITIAYDSTDRLYLLTFKTPTSQWSTKGKEYGSAILSDMDLGLSD